MLIPKVSIIIPFFNPGKLFADCLNSAANQSLKDIEIICVDDGSTDDESLSILSEFSNDNRFKIIHQENCGAGSARNNAIDNANGEFILFLDADDWIELDACEKLYEHAINLNSDIVLFDVIWHYKNNRTKKISYFSKNEFKEDHNSFTFDCHYVKNKMMRGILGVIWSKFYKTSFIKENKIRFPSHKIYNDIEFHFKTMMLAKSISYLPESFYNYNFINQPSLQNSFRDTEYELCWFDVMIGIRDFLNENDLMNEFKKEFFNFFLSYSSSKLDSINDEFKNSFFIKLKYFFESLNLSKNDLKLLNQKNLVFYIHMINSIDYATFIHIQKKFNGKIFK